MCAAAPVAKGKQPKCRAFAQPRQWLPRGGTAWTGPGPLPRGALRPHAEALCLTCGSSRPAARSISPTASPPLPGPARVASDARPAAAAWPQLCLIGAAFAPRPATATVGRRDDPDGPMTRTLLCFGDSNTHGTPPILDLGNTAGSMPLPAGPASLTPPSAPNGRLSKRGCPAAPLSFPTR